MYIEENGVKLELSFEPMASCYEVIDIDIMPGLKTLKFDCNLESANGSELYGMCIKLKGVKKQFPDIEEIIIGKCFTGIIDIDNEMFPNVKKVISKNNQYVSGSYLYAKMPKLTTIDGKTIKQGLKLMNVFCKYDTEINLTNVVHIHRKAFSGCKNLKFTHAENVTINEESIEGYDDARIEKSVIMIGNTVAKINTNNADIPSDTNNILKNAFVGCHIEHMIIHDIKFISKLQLCSGTIETLDIQDDSNFDFFKLYNIFSQVRIGKINNIVMTDNNTHIKIIDNIVYSKNGKVLLYCYPAETGHVDIPEGVERIHDYAFAFSEIDSVAIPDSVKQIGKAAFMKSDIHSVKLGNGIDGLIGGPSGIFECCNNLCEIDIPGNIKMIGARTFMSSGLKKIHLHEGLQYIESKAFSTCKLLYSVVLPESIKEIGIENFNYTKEITVKSIIPGIISSCTASNSFGYARHIRKFIFANINKTMYMPLVLDTSVLNMRKLDYLANYEPENFFTRETRKMIFNMANSDITKEELAVLYMQEGDFYAGIISRNGVQIAKRFISRDDTEMLLMLLNLNILKKEDLTKVLDIASEEKNAVMISYIMQKIKALKDSDNFTL